MNSEQINSLTLHEKVGQLFFIGITGTEFEGGVAQIISDISPGGVCLFARNVRTPDQVRLLLDDIAANLRVSPFLSLDQEGGLVDRLRRISTPMPSASSLRNAEDAHLLAEFTAEIIRTLGFNMNFAPVIDVMDEDRLGYSNGLHSRAFGKSKEDVVIFAGKYLETLQSGGILGCLKHFPGLGGARKDAHDELPSVEISNEELTEKDLHPYRELFRENDVSAVMIAHAGFPKCDLQETDQSGKLLPSSLSFNFVTKLLREDLGFTGVAITDDLEMGAVINGYGIGQACVMAIAAGEDMLAICASEDAIREGFSAIIEAIKRGELSEDRIDQSVDRILAAKQRISPPLPFNLTKLGELSNSIAELGAHVNYRYGG